MKRSLDTAVISDVHLGTVGCHAVELIQYLNSIDPKRIILNGDFIDMWQFKKSLVAEGILRHFAPSNSAVACHYLRYDEFIEPPIVRKQIQRLSPFRQDHVTVYLPAFNASELLPHFKQVPEIKWHFFTSDCEKA